MLDKLRGIMEGLLNYTGCRETFKTMVFISILLSTYYFVMFFANLLLGYGFSDLERVILGCGFSLIFLYAIHLITFENTEARIESGFFIVNPWVLAIFTFVGAFELFSKLSLRALQ